MSDYCYVNGIKINAFYSFDDICESINNTPSCIVVSIGAEAIINENPDIQEMSKLSHVITHADGVASVLCLKKVGLRNAKKIPGCECWLEYVKKYNSSVYLFGASEDVVKMSSEKLQSDNINVVGLHNGFFSEEQYSDIKKEILTLKPDVVVLALGQPKQEKIALELSNLLESRFFCVGGSLDVYSGKIKRAPKIFIRLHLEWLYRLLLEPRRITRQLAIPMFIAKFLFSSGFVLNGRRNL